MLNKNKNWFIRNFTVTFNIHSYTTSQSGYSYNRYDDKNKDASRKTRYAYYLGKGGPARIIGGVEGCDFEAWTDEFHPGDRGLV